MSQLYQHTTELSEIAWIYPKPVPPSYYGNDSIEECTVLAKTPVLFASTVNIPNWEWGAKWLQEHNWKPIASRLNASHGPNIITLWLKVIPENSIQPVPTESFVFSDGNWTRGAASCCGLRLRRSPAKKALSKFSARWLTLWERNKGAVPCKGWQKVADGIKKSYWVNV